MDFELLKKRKQSKSIPRKNTLSREIKKSIMMLIVTLLAIIILLSVVFLMNTSQSFQQGIVFQQAQMQKDQLLLKNRELVSKIIEAMSYNKMETSDVVKGMVKPESTIYLPSEKKDE